MATTPQQGPLQDRLKEQVSVSVKEALERTTIILSNLHRVHSYLDILRSMATPSGGCGQGIKSAMNQMHTVRNDVAALLQTVYLAEIGIQSLQDYEKEGVSGPSPLPALLSLLDAADMDSVEDGEQGGGTRNVEGAGPVVVEYKTPPPAKKRKSSELDGEIIITECSLCGKKFANSCASSVFLCRACRQSHASEATPPQPPSATNGMLSSEKRKTDASTSISRGPRGARGNLNRMSCKLCGASFLYKRCLHRHIRENHADVDLNNVAQYIQMSGMTDAESSVDTPTSNYGVVGVVSQPGGLGFDRAGSGGGGDDADQSMLYSISEEMGVSPDVLGAAAREAGLVEEEEEGISPQQQQLPQGESPTTDARQAVEKYVCATCNKTFDRPYRLQRHLQIHDPNRPKVTCHLCDKTFTRVDTLENHMKCLHSTDRPFKCTFTGCAKSFPLQSALVHHLKIHMDGKPYKCNECDTSFALLGEFRAHIAANHADTKDQRCTECYKVFPSPGELAQHIKLEHRLECEVCMKTFSRLAYLQAHVEIHNGESLFNCKYCVAGFDSEYAYKKHVKSHPKPPAKSPQSSHHLCTICDLLFESTATLMGHYRGDEHRAKVQALGLDGASILHTIEGELSPEIRSLVDEVAGSIGAAEVDERLMQTIGDGGLLRAANVTVVAVEDNGESEYQMPGGLPGDIEGAKGVTFEESERDVYGREGGQRPED